MLKRFLLVLVAATALALVPGAAFAHHPDVEGYQDCDGSVVFRAVSWMPPDDVPDVAKARTNRQVEIRIWPDDPTTAADDLSEAQIAALVPVHTGAFVPENNFEFGGVYGGIGKQAHFKIRATAAIPWEDGDQAGRMVQGDIAPKDCPAPSTSSSTTTTTVPPTTTTVLVVTHQQPPPPAEALPRTGTSTTVPILVGGLALVAAGAATLYLGRRTTANGGS
jgi:LPXTG-motif cell wall-anchored protein